MKNLFTIFLIGICSYTYSQPNFFERTYGLGRGMFIDHAFNGNYIIGSSTGTNPYFQGYYFLIDGNGDTIRSMSYSNSDIACIRQTSDGGFIFIGDSCCDHTAVVNKTDSAGNIQWHHYYESTSWGTYPAFVIPNYENGYFVAFIDDGDGPENSYIILKTDSSGNTIDSTVVNTSIWDWLLNFGILTQDSGLITVNNRDQSFQLTKLDKDNQVLWNKMFYDTTLSFGAECFGVVQTSDGGYLTAGFKSIPMGASWKYGFVMKTDANGDSLWSKTIEFPNANVYLTGVLENSAGQFYFIGEYRDSIFYTKPSVLILKTSATGDTIWSRTYSGYGIASPRSIVLDSAENPMVLGWTEDTVTQQKYIYLIKTDTSGNIQVTINTLTLEENEISVYPNPSQSKISITFQKENAKELSIELRNLMGQLLFEKKESNLTDALNMTIDIGNLPSGIYLLQIRADEKEIFKKIIKE